MPVDVRLSQEDEAFVLDCARGGRYRDVADVVRRGLLLLRKAENDVARFNAMLDEVTADIEKNGTLDAEDVLREVDEIIERAERRRAAG